MIATHGGDGTITIQFNSQGEVLLAPDGQKYLPCNWCGALLTVPLNTVSVGCRRCREHMKACEDDDCSDPTHWANRDIPTLAMFQAGEFH